MPAKYCSSHHTAFISLLFSYILASSFSSDKNVYTPFHLYFITKENVTNQNLTNYDLIPVLACPLVSMPIHTSLQLYSLVHNKVQYTVCCDAFLPELKQSSVCTLLLVHTWPESLTFNLNKLWLPYWQLVNFPSLSYFWKVLTIDEHFHHTFLFLHISIHLFYLQHLIHKN